MSEVTKREANTIEGKEKFYQIISNQLNCDPQIIAMFYDPILEGLQKIQTERTDNELQNVAFGLNGIPITNAAGIRCLAGITIESSNTKIEDLFFQHTSFLSDEGGQETPLNYFYMMFQKYQEEHITVFDQPILLEPGQIGFYISPEIWDNILKDTTCPPIQRTLIDKTGRETILFIGSEKELAPFMENWKKTIIQYGDQKSIELKDQESKQEPLGNQQKLLQEIEAIYRTAYFFPPLKDYNLEIKVANSMSNNHIPDGYTLETFTEQIYKNFRIQEKYQIDLNTFQSNLAE